jgi:hypothetical protein
MLIYVLEIGTTNTQRSFVMWTILLLVAMFIGGCCLVVWGFRVAKEAHANMEATGFSPSCIYIHEERCHYRYGVIIFLVGVMAIIASVGLAGIRYCF